MVPILAAGAARIGAMFGRSKAILSTSPTVRGAGGTLPTGAANAGGSSPLDMLGNVANIGGLGLQGFEMFGKGGGHDKPKGSGGTGTPYETQL